MTITAGCDVGSLTAKAVIMKDGDVLAAEVIRARARPELSARAIMDQACRTAGIGMDCIECCLGTGYGRKKVSFVTDVRSEIACHARGARWYRPSVRTIIDIGGQDAKAIAIDGDGNIVHYLYNDKCASGTGRFLEIMAAAMEIPLEQMGPLSEQATRPENITNQCAVFAETEVISLVNDGHAVPDIVKSLHQAMARRVASLAKAVGMHDEVIMTGGVAKNQGVFHDLETALGTRLHHMTEFDPQINGALGAALFAADVINR